MGPQDASDRIWLKQSVQFSVAGQVRTIEIALPVRPGASAEEIERLLRQADAGLDQMTQHLNHKVSALLNQEQAPSPWGGAGARSPRGPNMPAAASPGDQGRAGGLSTPSGALESLAGEGAESLQWSGARPGDALPAAGPPLDRKQFIAEIAMLGFNPNTAMKRLGLHSLEGVNLRQALEQLRLELLHDRPAPQGASPAQDEPADSPMPDGLSSRGAARPPSVPPLRRSSPELSAGAPLSEAAPAERTRQRSARGSELADDEELPMVEEAAPERPAPKRVRERAPAPIPIRGQRTLHALQEQAQARELLERLRQIRGRLNPPSSDNLKAFRYVVEEQIGAAKTAELLQAVWKVSAPERLSPDQVAECIRWGKADHFEDEVDMLLRLTATEES